MIGDDTNEEPGEQPTELVMKKEGDCVVMWAVVGGEQVFSASPHITAVKQPIVAAVQSWVSRAFREELDEIHDLGSDSGGFW